ncbi:flavoprotein [Microlunatus sp. Gsoil 973]|uniref:flavoprotein n=1 Tax=Microlunatus sp. Gsoil 973 TaxID=2672569 RepID=UPI0012B4D330|nr:flavoprotein [Microlunatus sp. Gsoil 973]QGN31552.1 flavoprotein [Microlunatus sp. Gsoil 973]
MRNLGIVVTGAPLAARTADLITTATAAGWQTSLAITESARPWLAGVDLSDTGFREPGAPKRPRPDALCVLPLTFNTGSKWALGIADNRALSLLCETLGAGKPIVAVPLVNQDLWGHPAWPRHLDTLASAGAVMIDPATGDPVARPQVSDDVDDLVRHFDPDWLLAGLGRR